MVRHSHRSIPPHATVVHGQESFTLATRSVRAAITRFGAMLGPVTFFADGVRPIEPYSIAPWATEEPRHDTPRLLSALRGDFVCSAFGDNGEPLHGRHVPAHGDTANGDWTWIWQREDARGAALRLAIEMATQGGRCVSSTILLEGHSFIYQRHDFEGLAGPINPGHHAMLRCDPKPGSARLSFSPHVFAGATPPRDRLPDTHLRSRLAPGLTTSALTSMACLDGTSADVTSFPAAESVDDFFMVCADPSMKWAWSAATFPAHGYAWLSLRNRAQLPSTLVWLSNGGMLGPPWNGRHRPVLALEDVMAYFAAGIAESARPNPLNALGIATSTCVRPDAPLRVPYIQGVVAIPDDFDRVASVEPCEPGLLRVRAGSGVTVEVGCRWEFLTCGQVGGLCED